MSVSAAIGGDWRAPSPVASTPPVAPDGGRAWPWLPGKGRRPTFGPQRSAVVPWWQPTPPRPDPAGPCPVGAHHRNPYTQRGPAATGPRTNRPGTAGAGSQVSDG